MIICSYLGMGRMQVLNTRFWAIGVTFRKSIPWVEAQQANVVSTVAVFSDSQVAIRPTTNLDPDPGQQLAAVIIEHASALHTSCNKAEIRWVLGHWSIPENEEVDHQSTNPRED